MGENFFLFLAYKGKVVKLKVINSSDSLTVLMEKLKRLQLFDMPAMDPSGAPLDYYFCKIDESGQQYILNPKIGRTDMFLHDYDVVSGDLLTVIYVPIAG